MSDASVHPAVTPSCACPQCGRGGGFDAERAAALRELAGIGMDLARALRRVVVEAAAPGAPTEDGPAEGEPAVGEAAVSEPSGGEASPAPSPASSSIAARVFAGGAADAALAFSRLSRAVRLTYALEARLADGLSPGARRAAEAEAAERRAEAERKRQIAGLINKHDAFAAARRAVKAAARERGEGFDAEALLEALDERLDETGDLEAFADLPVPALAAVICEDLGVPFDPALWTPADSAEDDEDDEYDEYEDGGGDDGPGEGGDGDGFGRGRAGPGEGLDVDADDGWAPAWGRGRPP